MTETLKTEFVHMEGELVSVDVKEERTQAVDPLIIEGGKQIQMIS